MRKRIVFIFFVAVYLLCFGEAWAAVSYSLDNARDPFQSLLPSQLEFATDSNPPDLSVSGLVWGSDRPTAIINDKVIRLGEEINGAKVIEISKIGVTVLYNGKLYEIKPNRVSPE